MRRAGGSSSAAADSPASTDAGRRQHDAGRVYKTCIHEAPCSDYRFAQEGGAIYRRARRRSAPPRNGPSSSATATSSGGGSGRRPKASSVVGCWPGLASCSCPAGVTSSRALPAIRPPFLLLRRRLLLLSSTQDRISYHLYSCCWAAHLHASSAWLSAVALRLPGYFC